VSAFFGILLSAGVSFLLVLLTIFFVALYNKKQLVTIDDVTNTTTIRLSNPKPQEYFGAICILITGRIDGTASVGTGGYLDRHISSGKVYVKIHGEWYDQECLLEYKPVNVSSGSLKIRYYYR
jgi:hypothetical protein